MTRFSRIISYLFHPIVVPALCVLIIMNLNVYPYVLYPTNAKYIFTGMIFINTYILPLIVVYLLRKAGMIASVFMTDKRERIAPVFFVSVMLYVSYYVANSWNLPALIKIVLLIYAILGIITVFVSFVYKISLHMIGWGSMVGLMGYLIIRYNTDNFIAFSGGIFISGLVAFARTEMKQHNAWEIISGFLTGMFVLLLGLTIFFKGT